MPPIHHAEIYGPRQDKTDWLDDHDVENTEWQAIDPKPDFFLFVPRDRALQEAYDAFVPVPDVFPVHSVGIVTARDKLTIHWTADEAWHTVMNFARMAPDLARKGYKLGKDVRDWKVGRAQEDLRDSGPSRHNVVPILYRPFDVRYTYYTGVSRGFHCMPRPEVMQHMLQENLALISPKQNQDEFGALVTTTIGAHKSLAAYHINYYFPLYVYPDVQRDDLFAHLAPSDREPNLHPDLVPALAEAYGRTPSPEEIFHYIYAVLYAPTYRERYAEFLRTDFPRVPFTADAGLFAELAALGERLVALHLLRSDELDPPAARFEGQGDSKVARTKSKGFRYDEDEQRAYINPAQYFAPVPPEVWEVRVGGYQVCHKWLKDRKERRLSVEEVKTYCRIVTALGLTLGIQQEVDERYMGVEERLLPVALGG
ncbi:MAG: type ISP restriction/modification enzyme [Candidatus Brocadiia bacterium]